VTKIDAFAHILPPAYAERLEALTSGDAVSQPILGYRPWIREDEAAIFAGNARRRLGIAG
jgi:hypothetical protein